MTLNSAAVDLPFRRLIPSSVAEQVHMRDVVGDVVAKAGYPRRQRTGQKHGASVAIPTELALISGRRC